MRFLTTGRLIAAFCCLLGTANGLSAHPILSDAIDNQSWHASEATGEAIYVGDAKSTPTLVIKKSVVRDQRLALTITTDANACVLHSGLAKLTLDLTKDKANVLTLSGAAAQPAVLVNGKESAPNKGKWIQLCSDGTSTIAVELPGAAYATVKFNTTAAETSVPTPATKPADGDKRAPAGAEGGKVAHTSSHGAPNEVPFMTIPANVKAQQMVLAANALRVSGLRVCPVCSGKGKITVHEKTGETRNGGFVQSNYRDSTSDCSNCHGTGRLQANIEALNRLSEKLLNAMAGADQEEKGYADRTKAVAAILTDTISVDHDGQLMFSKDALTALRPRPPKAGRTLVLLGHLAFVEPFEKASGNLYSVQSDSGGMVILLTNPRVADGNPGDSVVIGGIYVGSAGSDANNQMPVLQDGFIVRNTSGR